ncbi:hypothetical protein ACFOD0_04575 [Shewanella intestini]|uniref:Uncharacterized protein n=1 Tax=Shewanella intestini TaxID=2017544 RepID=A0ABS5I178_9GAMM|nr:MULTISPECIES: hypothetical protein [Shewanella]MBR9727578.1 hypothetical protein [Shewanella intestini]MRG35272.1 hypothetical protein [Shewanella sp. XMDDZSB0408]
MPIRVYLLFTLYILLAVVSLWKAISFTSFDLLTIGVFPVIVGLVYKTRWARVVLFVYIILQSLGFIAMSVVAIIAYQITPEDVNIVVNDINIPILPLALSLLSIIIFQWWVVCTKPIKQYLAN